MAPFSSIANSIVSWKGVSECGFIDSSGSLWWFSSFATVWCSVKEDDPLLQGDLLLGTCEDHTQMWNVNYVFEQWSDRASGLSGDGICLTSCDTLSATGLKNVRAFVSVLCVEPFSERRKRPFWKFHPHFSAPTCCEPVVEDVVRMIKISYFLPGLWQLIALRFSFRLFQMLKTI